MQKQSKVQSNLEVGTPLDGPTRLLRKSSLDTDIPEAVVVKKEEDTKFSALPSPPQPQPQPQPQPPLARHRTEFETNPNVHPSKVRCAGSKEEIIMFLNQGYFVQIDPLIYDISAEANSKISFNVGNWIEDVLINVLAPFSTIYVYLRYGVSGLRNRHLITGLIPSKHNPIEHDAEPPVTQLKASGFYRGNVIMAISKFSLITFYILGEYNNKGHSERRTNTPTYYLFLVLLCYFNLVFMLANKKALRNKESEARLLLHREKRNEELINGWLPLPWWIAVFELRIAAFKSNLDLSSTIFFKGVTPEKLRTAIGEKTLGYLATSCQFDPENPSVPTSGCEHVFDEMSTRGGSSCTAMALLLRGCLEDSYATPAFGEDATAPITHGKSDHWWSFVCYMLILSPIVIDYFLHDGDVVYDVYAVMCIVVSLSFMPVALIGAPKAFVYGAILSIRRKTRLQSFLNNMIDCSSSSKRISKWQSSWPLVMDFSDPKNFEVWGQCRSCVLKFGRRYKERTDVNAGMMIFFLGITTAGFVVLTTVDGQKVYFWDLGFYIFIHVCFILILGSFSIVLAVEGEDCDDFGMRTKIVLSNALLKFESLNRRIHNECTAMTVDEKHDMALNLSATRNATNQIHSLIDASQILHKNRVMGMIPLNKALVGSVLFICFTQLTLILENTTFKK